MLVYVMELAPGPERDEFGVDLMSILLSVALAVAHSLLEYV